MNEQSDDIDWPELADAIEAGNLTVYLLDSRTATDIITTIANETRLPVYLVRLVVKGVARLLAARGKSLLSWSSSAVATKALDTLQKLPGAETVKQALWHWHTQLSDTAARRNALDAVLNGTASEVDPEIAKGFSDGIRLALQNLNRIDAQTDELRTVLGQDRDALHRRLDDLQSHLNPQPPLDDKMLGGNHRNWLAFGARHVPFVGREAEVKALNAFLGANDDGVTARFRWWLALGAGGVGKSRLALEFCLQAGLHWQTGFLATDDLAAGDKGFNWNTWQPEQPTLIIVDYVGMRPEPVGAILRTLARRAQQNELDAPVRVLMMERNRDNWWDRLRSGGSADYRLDDYRHDPNDLLLQTMNDDAVWSIVETILEEKGKPCPDRADTLARIAEIDPDRRPLFVALAAESFAEHGTLRNWDRERLLADVLDRDKRLFWPKEIDTGPYANLLCLTTMVGGLPIGLLKDPPQEIALPLFDEFVAENYARMARADIDPETLEVLPPLAPDIVGEYFVLNHLTGSATPAQRADRVRRFQDAAWGLHEIDRMYFMTHLDKQMQDFPAIFPIELLDARQPKDTEASSRLLWGMVAVNAIARLGEFQPSDKLHALLKRLRAAAKAHPNEPEIRLEWAKGAVNLIHDLPASGADGLDQAQGLLARLRDTADDHPDEPEIRLAWAKGAVNLISGLSASGADGLDQAQGLLARLHDTADDHPDEPEIRQEWAQGAFNLIYYLPARGADGLSQAHDLLKRLRDNADAYPDEPEIRLQWAEGVVNLIHDLPASGTDGPNQAEDLYSALLQDVATTGDDVLVKPLAQASFALARLHLSQNQIEPAVPYLAQTVAIAGREPVIDALRQILPADKFDGIMSDVDRLVAEQDRDTR